MAVLYSQPKPVDWEAIDFNLPSVDDKNYALANFADKQGVLVVFSCNHCPYAKASWPLLVELHKKYGDKVGFVAINPNDANQYPDDSIEAMKTKAQEWGIEFPYLYDESQATAKAYGAQCTPDPYLFINDGSKLKLFYHGRINDNWQHPDQVKEKNLEEALEKLINRSEPPSPQNPSMGCSIKWKE